MAKVTRRSVLVVENEKKPVSELLEDLIYLGADQFVQFFRSIGLTIPRVLRMNVLKDVLRATVNAVIEERKNLADEFSHRLVWYEEYSESQYENLLALFDNPELSKKYLEEFWIEILGYMINKGVAENNFSELFSLARVQVKATGKVIPEMMEYNRLLNPVFFDQVGKIDGLSPKIFRPVLYNSSTLAELNSIGSKYGVDVPRRIKKNELASIIIDEIKSRDELTKDLEDKIKGMSVIMLKRFAKDNDIKASTDLNKEEIIEFILANARETKEAYFVPSSNSAYHMEIQETISAREEEVATEEVVTEEIAEEVMPQIEIEEVDFFDDTDSFLETTTDEVENYEDAPEDISHAIDTESLETTEFETYEEPVTEEVTPVITEEAYEDLAVEEVAPVMEEDVYEEPVIEEPILDTYDDQFFDDSTVEFAETLGEPEEVKAPVYQERQAPQVDQGAMLATRDLIEELKAIRQAIEQQTKITILTSNHQANPATSLMASPTPYQEDYMSTNLTGGQMMQPRGLVNQQSTGLVAGNQYGLVNADTINPDDIYQPEEFEEKKRPLELTIVVNVLFAILWIVLIFVIFVIVYVIFTQFSGNAEQFEAFDNTIDSALKIGGKGVIQHLREFFGQLGGN